MSIPNAVAHDSNKKAPVLLGAFCKGCGGVVYDDVTKAGKHLAIYGVKGNQRPLFDLADEFWYIDNGYMRSSVNKFKFDGYYRIVKNSWYFETYMQQGRDDKRFKELNLRVHPWRKDSKRGRSIYLVPPTEFMIPIIKDPNWLKRTTKLLRQYTDRPIKVSTKTSPIGSWNDVWCVVTCMSNLQVETLLRGIPVITTRFTKIGYLDQIENPPGEEVRTILYDMAYEQWTFKQIETGQAWRELNSSHATE